MSVSYKIRIDSHDRTAIKLLLDKYCDKFIIAFEGEEVNPHCHGLIVTTAKQATIRSNLRKSFGSGNGSYSMKELDEEYPLEYLAYLVKEGDYYNSGVPDDLLQKAIEYDKDVKAQMKEKKASRRTVLEKLEERLSSVLVDVSCNYTMYKFKVLEGVVAYYKDTGTLVRDFAVISQVQTLCLKYYPTGSNEMVCRLLEKI